MSDFPIGNHKRRVVILGPDGNPLNSSARGGKNVLSVEIVDGSGNQITTFGGGTEYADGAARGTATGGLMMVDDGTLIQSMSGDSSGRPNVNVISSGLPTGASTLAEQQSQTTALQIIDDWDETDRCKVNPIAGQAGVQGGAGASNALTQRVAIATDANVVSDLPVTTGGLSKFHLVSAASTNATNVKASAGQVYSIVAFNLNAAARYLKFHNTAGTPTAGSGVTDTFMIPGNTAGAGFVFDCDKGITFSTGIGITLVTGITDADSTGVAASEIVLQVYYK